MHARDLALLPLAFALAAWPARAQITGNVEDLDSVGCAAGECDHAPPEPEKPAEPRQSDAPVVPAVPDAACANNHPRSVKDSAGAPVNGRVTVGFVVHSDGSVHDVAPVGDAEGALFGSVREYLRVCRFTPARALGRPLAVRMTQAFSFRTVSKPAEPGARPRDPGPPRPKLPATVPEDPPRLLGSDTSRPQPTELCQPPKPPLPAEAKEKGISGLVLVEYVVHTDGHVGEVENRNLRAPPLLFEAVRAWLLACPFEPSHLEGGRPIAVKIIQPFTFKQSR